MIKIVVTECEECEKDFTDFSNKSKMICLWFEGADEVNFSTAKATPREVCANCYHKLIKQLITKYERRKYGRGKKERNL